MADKSSGFATIEEEIIVLDSDVDEEEEEEIDSEVETDNEDKDSKPDTPKEAKNIETGKRKKDEETRQKFTDRMNKVKEEERRKIKDEGYEELFEQFKKFAGISAKTPKEAAEFLKAREEDEELTYEDFKDSKEKDEERYNEKLKSDPKYLAYLRSQDLTAIKEAFPNNKIIQKAKDTLEFGETFRNIMFENPKISPVRAMRLAMSEDEDLIDGEIKAAKSTGGIDKAELENKYLSDEQLSKYSVEDYKKNPKLLKKAMESVTHNAQKNLKSKF
jgi:hypothetical protein